MYMHVQGCDLHCYFMTSPTVAVLKARYLGVHYVFVLFWCGVLDLVPSLPQRHITLWNQYLYTYGNNLIPTYICPLYT